MDKGTLLLSLTSIMFTAGYIGLSAFNGDKKIARTLWGTGFFLAVIGVLKVAFSI